MRWSERPPAVRSRFSSLQPVRSSPCALPVAVAHLVLVRRNNMRARGTQVVWLAVLSLHLAVAEISVASSQRHCTREQALALLRREGFYPPTTRIESATWHSNLNQWLIILQLRDGTVTHWFVDAQAQNLSGGTCRH